MYYDLLGVSVSKVKFVVSGCCSCDWSLVFLEASPVYIYKRVEHKCKLDEGQMDRTLNEIGVSISAYTKMTSFMLKYNPKNNHYT